MAKSKTSKAAAASMKRFTCVSIGNTTRTNERIGESAEKVAEQCAKAIHGAYWAEAWRTGEDRHGSYGEFTIKAGSRIDSTVRVYENYTH